MQKYNFFSVIIFLVFLNLLRAKEKDKYRYQRIYPFLSPGKF